MTSTVAVLGANGVYGRHLVPRLISRGFDVRALVRRPAAAGVAKACGANVRAADIFDEASLCAALEGCDVGINLATSLPGPSGRGDFDANDHLRRNGTPVWVAAAKRAGVKRIVQQSIAMVNAAGADRWADEETPFAGTQNEITRRAIDATLAMEDVVRRSELDWLILRGGLFYGPGTGFDDDWFARAKAGTLRMPGDGESFVSLVHITDMVGATVAALHRWPSRQAIIVADDGPARWREVFTYITDLLGSPAPDPGGRAGFPSFRMKNTKAREALGWSPYYSDYRAGLVR